MVSKTCQATAIFTILAEKNPAPRTELEFPTPFCLLTAVLLSAQATDKQVNIATKELFTIADTPSKMAALGLEAIEQHIKSIGLYRTKAKNLLATAIILRDQYDSQIPKCRKTLETLPGVGRKTANVVLNELYGMPTMAVDTHIFRMANRTGLAKGTTPLAIEKGLCDVIPDQFMRHAHHHMILHGRYVCKARKPDCGACLIKDHCDFDEKTA